MHRCEREGKEEELIEKPCNLLFYDYVAANTMNMGVARSDHQRPRCGETLKTHHLIAGMIFDQ
jgi:hypothetical protein